MGRDDDAADVPRGGGGNGRSKRAVPSGAGGLAYDPATAAGGGHRHVRQVYVAPRTDAPRFHPVYTNEYPPPPQPPSTYPVPQHGDAMYNDETMTTNKRKRVKREREDEWAPAPPAPPVAYATSDMGSMHMAMPTILHRASAVVNAASEAAVYDPPQYAAPMGGPTHTIFSEAPVVIESFAETERRRANTAAVSTSANANARADLNQLIHADQSASATSPPKSNSNGVAAWNSRAGSSGTMSVYDVFFPTPSRSKEATRNGTRESKRRRRNNGDAAERSTTRASSRRGTSAPDDSLEVDMLRFTVDSFKLIPQGLVDRIDARLRPRIICSLIAGHVENWIKRAGFDDQNFLQEITTLLNVYYPCTHPTLLDEVLVAFVFKRPELMDRMMTSVIDRLLKTGESANPSKYPVIDSFARRCGMSERGGIPKRDQARHDLACLTVLRLLLERNTEKFMLSPWIASCAVLCSDEVLNSMWHALLLPLVSTGKATLKRWNVRDPLDQVFELLREEKQLVRYSDGDSCRLSATLIKKIVQDDAYTDLRSAPVACEAFELFFGRSTNSSRLIETWIDFEQQRTNGFREEALDKVVRLTIENCARLSVKKSNWFMKHMLDFVVSVSTVRLFKEVILTRADLFLGGVDKNEMEEIEGSAASTESEGENGSGASKAVIVGKVSSNEKNAQAGVVAQLGLLLEFMRAIPGDTGVSLVRAWSDTWCSSNVHLPWSYVWGVVSSATAIQVTGDAPLNSLESEFHAFACRLTKQYVDGLLKRDNAVQCLSRIVRLLEATIQDLPNMAAAALVGSILEAVSMLPKSSSLAEQAHNAIATMLAESVTRQGVVVTPVAVHVTDSEPSRKQQMRAALLQSLSAFCSRNDSVGRLVREQLVQRRRLGMVVLNMCRDGNEDEANAALKVMTSVIIDGSSRLHVNGERNMWLSSAVETIVTLGYRVRRPGTRQSAIILLNAMSARDDVLAQKMLWSVLRICTDFCCGCSTRASKPNQQPDAAPDFADLTKYMLKRAPQHVLMEVGDFIQQEIRSCGPSRAQWNLFLVLVLDRVVQLGWSQMAAVPKLANVVLSPFDGVQHSASREDQVAQLRTLKSLCVIILAESSSDQSSRHRSTWLPVARALVSDQMASKLKSICSASTSGALAQSVVLLCDNIKECLERREQLTVNDIQG